MRLARPRLRTKLFLVALALLAIPYVGYRYVREMETHLRQGQESALLGTARAVATVLHEHRELFRGDADASGEAHVYARSLSGPRQLDGYADDWEPDLDLARRYGSDHVLEGRAAHRPGSLSFRHVTGIQGNHLYALFQVHDDAVVYRQAGEDPHSGDHVRVALIDKAGRFNRYLIGTGAPGAVHAVREDPGTGQMRSEPRIRGAWQERSDGYTLELRIPLYMLGPKVAFAVADVDDPRSREVTSVIGTADTQTPSGLATVVIPSPEVQRVLRGLERAESRIWVIDRHRRVVALTGELVSREPEPLTAAAEQRNILTGIMHLLYGLILEQPSTQFDDPLAGASRLQGNEIAKALAGAPATRWRRSDHGRTLVLVASHPVRGEDQTLGAVVVEQTSNAILTVQNRAMETLFNITLAVFVVAAVVLLAFASRLSGRIRRLADDAGEAIGPDGKVRATTVRGARAGDEIGDLARSINDMLARLGQYTRYLEGMAGKLAHELRTPLTVVRSSLDNLETSALPEEAHTYSARARDGLERLTTILNRLSEATRLEQALQQAERETFDLVELAGGCTAAYRDAYPQQSIEADLPRYSVPCHGVADLIAQMLDKLVANAVEFSDGREPVVIALAGGEEEIQLTVTNSGPSLPDEMVGRLFDSMVSVRGDDKRDAPHLGLGLYIVRLIAEFHGGRALATNRPDGQGAVFTITLPASAPR